LVMPTLSLAEAAIVIVPPCLTVAPFSGEVILTLGGVVSIWLLVGVGHSGNENAVGLLRRLVTPSQTVA